MKHKLIFLLMITCFLSQNHLQAFVMKNKYVPAEYVVIAQTIRRDMAIKLSKRHHMSLFGEKGGLADCVNILGLSFQIKGPLTKDQLREILIDCVEEFLAAINGNEKLRPHLKNYPFTPKELDISLYIQGSNGEDIYDPEIGTAGAWGGKLEYKTDDPDNIFVYKSRFEEDYQTALDIVRGKK